MKVVSVTIGCVGRHVYRVCLGLALAPIVLGAVYAYNQMKPCNKPHRLWGICTRMSRHGTTDCTAAFAMEALALPKYCLSCIAVCILLHLWV
jgi:hypothetical protein